MNGKTYSYFYNIIKDDFSDLIPPDEKLILKYLEYQQPKEMTLSGGALSEKSSNASKDILSVLNLSNLNKKNKDYFKKFIVISDIENEIDRDELKDIFSIIINECVERKQKFFHLEVEDMNEDQAARKLEINNLEFLIRKKDKNIIFSFKSDIETVEHIFIKKGVGNISFKGTQYHKKGNLEYFKDIKHLYLLAKYDINFLEKLKTIHSLEKIKKGGYKSKKKNHQKNVKIL